MNLIYWLQDRLFLLTENKRRLWLILFGAFIVVVAILWPLLLNSHRNKEPSQKQIQAAIADYYQLQTHHQSVALTDIVPLLSFLQGSHRKEAKDIIKAGLAHYFIPLLDQLYQYTLTHDLGDSRKLYPALEAYLMLGNTDKLDLATLASLTHNLLPQFSAQTFLSLLKECHISELKYSLNNALIEAARTKFKALPLEEQAWAIFTTEYPQTLQINSSSPYVSIQHPTLLTLYTQAEFNKTVTERIPQITEQVLTGNWIIGTTHFPEVNPNDVNALLYNLYLTAYVNAWGDLLSSIKIKPFPNEAEALTFLKSLTTKDSPITELLTQVKNNTNFTPIATLNSAIAKINAYTALPESDITSLSHTLNPMIATLSHLSSAEKKKAFVLRSLDQPALFLFPGQLPPPLKQWMHTISEQVWQLYLNNTLAEIDALWQPLQQQYRETLAGKYPLSHTGSQDVEIAAFINFFKPQGILDKFFQENLQAFIDQDHALWQWKKINGLKPPENSNLLHLQEMMSLHALFFQQKKLAFSFQLTPVALSDGLQEFSFQLDQQSVPVHSADNALATNFTWTGTPDSIAAMIFTTEAGKIIRVEKRGPWALFHLMNTSTLIPTANPHSVEITFSEQNFSAAFLLSSDQNPMVLSNQAFDSPGLPTHWFKHK